MVGVTMMPAGEKKIAGLLHSAKSAADLPSKLHRLRRLQRALARQDSSFLAALLPPLFDLLSDTFGPVRKFATEIVGESGLHHADLLPEIVPALISALDDATPAVVRQVIACGTELFRRTIQTVAIQGLYSSELDDSLVSSWEWMLKFKEKIFSIAFQRGSGGVRLLALKFVEAVILFYTPDPNGSSEPPSNEENTMEFNISWVRSGHPVLNVGDLSTEASQRLGLLLDELRSSTGNSPSNSSTTIVLINSLSAIAKKRPAFYGRILPVLLGFNPSTSVINGVHVSGSHLALKHAFLSCLECTHPAAGPWRDRLVGALRKLNSGGIAEKFVHASNINGGERDQQENSPISEEVKPIFEAHDERRNLGKKRSGSHENDNSVKDDDTPGKRMRSTPSFSEDSSNDLDRNVSDEMAADSTGPVYQLVTMFGALVAQGEKAVGSLEILISSISADLLAELVIVNMRNLPPNLAIAEGDDEPLLNMKIACGDSQAQYPQSFVENVLSLSTAFPKVALQLETRPPVVSEEMLQKYKGEEERVADNVTETPLPSIGPSASSDVSSEIGKDSLNLPSNINDDGKIKSEIPGLEDFNKEKDKYSGEMNLPTLVSTERSDEHSPKAPIPDANNLVSSAATSDRDSHQIVLPKMVAPVINLADDEKDEMQKSAFVRVIESYRNIPASGDGELRSSLLAHLGVEFCSELDPWKLLQKHIFEDYTNHQGHELTLRVLYRLFGEAEDRDFFSSTTATSAYEIFLLTALETLRDSFPPSDKLLSKLLAEVPYLPNKVLNLLEGMCSPASSDKAENGDRVMQGLSTVWSLILLRPPFRDACLKIALKSAVHHAEEVRMKAIRLVANKLYSMPSIAQRIEDFARETLLSVVNGDVTENLVGEGPVSEIMKDSNSEKNMNDLQSTSTSLSSDAQQSLLSVSEAQRCMSLYFALCTKKHSLFREIFVGYKNASRTAMQAVERHIPILVRTMGSSPDLLEIISDPPNGSEQLLFQVLHTLTDGTVASQELIYSIKKLYDSRLKDAEILIPILPYLSKDELLLRFPQVLKLPSDKFQAVLARILQGSPQSGPFLAPAEVLIAIHGVDPDRDGVPLKKVTDACNTCFEQPQIFTQQVLAQVLNQLVEQIPLSVLFMRTVLQAIGAFPALVDFAMEILSRLVKKQIWKYPKLWVGFLKCALLTKPQSLSVVLQLPPAQLENALNRTPALKAPLIAHASEPGIQSNLPRSVLVVLGIASDSQSSQPQAGETTIVDKEVAEEKPKESSDAS